MEQQKVNRREFLGDSAKVAAGVALGLGTLQVVRAGNPANADTSKIRSYNENMEYRRQGSMDVMVSAVCLGGHSRSDVKERTEIVSRCIDAGINYIDACCHHEVCRDAQALKGRRDKMYLALSHCEKEVRNEQYQTAKQLLASLDSLLKDSGEEYTDLWRITCYEPGGRHTFNTSCELVEALETAKKQGKARAIGFSSHDRDWIKFMIEYFPQVDVVCFPFFQMSKQAPSHSLFESLKKHDVGAFGIKPFGAGSLFRDDTQANTERARLALRYILHTNTVVPIPGLNSLAEVDNAVQAIKERRELDAAEQARLHQDGQRMLAKLPPTYHWLKNWQSV